MILKLYEDASSSKINFSKAKPCGLNNIKTELINQHQWNSNNILFNYLVLILVTLSLIDNSNWDKISEGITKKSNLEQTETLFET